MVGVVAGVASEIVVYNNREQNLFATNEQAKEMKTTADTNWFQAAWRQAGHIEKDRSKLSDNIYSLFAHYI